MPMQKQWIRRADFLQEIKKLVILSMHEFKLLKDSSAEADP
jgi:hypothetical protein